MPETRVPPAQPPIDGPSNPPGEPDSVPALAAPVIARDNPLTRSLAGVLGLAFLGAMLIACLGTLPWTLGSADDATSAVPRYSSGEPAAGRISPMWWPADERERLRLNALVPEDALAEIAERNELTPAEVVTVTDGPIYGELASYHPRFLLGSDLLGRSVFVRALTGGGISLGIGIAAAFLSVAIGTLYGAIAGYAGGKTDAILMRIVDVLYGLPYILLVVLICGDVARRDRRGELADAGAGDPGAGAEPEEPAVRRGGAGRGGGARRRSSSVICSRTSWGRSWCT
jgi:hypothetical protein